MDKQGVIDHTVITVNCQLNPYGAGCILENPNIYLHSMLFLTTVMVHTLESFFRKYKDLVIIRKQYRDCVKPGD